LGQLAVDVDRLEVEESERQRKLQRLVARGRKDDDFFACKQVYEVHQVGFFVLGRAEEVCLFERVHRFVLGVHFNLDRVV